jgi:putative flavoprotein involved in K+ transport
VGAAGHAAARGLGPAYSCTTLTDAMEDVETLQAVVVGGGQAGLATSHALTGLGVRHVVLDAEQRVGDQWRRRWDSLRLFTTARYDQLPGLAFPAPAASYPGKEAMADYLEQYARAGGLPVRSGVRALKLARKGDGYLLDTSAGPIEASHVVVATGGYQRPKVPPFASEIDRGIRQLHSSAYRNPSQLTGDVLVVGAGTSGVEIAIDAARAGFRTLLGGRGTPAIPPIVYAFNGRIFWFFATRVATVRTPIGRLMRTRVRAHGQPLVRVTVSDATAAGVELTPRVLSVENGRLVFADGRRRQPGTIVWCTGFERDYSWIEMPVAGPDGYPRQTDGAAQGEPGLYFMGLPFQTCVASALVGGAGDDARLVASAIARRLADTAGGRRALPPEEPGAISRGRPGRSRRA